jgi:hypothetical protein
MTNVRSLDRRPHASASELARAWTRQGGRKSVAREYVTIKEAAESVGVAADTIRRAITAGDLIEHDVPGATPGETLDREAVRAWAKSKRLVFS